MENNDQERIEIINNITMISRGNAGTWQAGKDLIGHMLIAEQNGQNFAYILNVQGLNDYRFEFIEAILSPKARLSNKSVLQKYLESDNISPADKYTAKQALMRTLFLSEPGLLQEYLESNDIQPENKQQCLNVLANNSKIIEDYLTHHSCKVSFIETLFKPREELGDQSYFDKIENQQSIKDALLLNKDVFGEYLTDARISPQSKQQYLNKLAGNVGEHGAIENYLADNRVIEILFEPQDGLNGQSYFDGIENKQSIVSGLMSGAYQSSLNRYLHLDYMINWEMFDLEKRQRCLNKLAGNDGEEGAIEYYLTIPYNDFDKKVELIKILFEPRGELGGQSYFDRIENKQSIVGGILANNLSLLDMYHPTTYEPDRRKRENNERKAIENRLRNLNKLAGNVGEHGAIENYLSNPNNDDNKKVELMKTLFKPRGELDGQSYFDGIENQQSILNSLLSGNNHSVLEQYLADHDIDRYGKQQCMNRFVNSRAIENYLTNLNNDFDKKADLIETLFKPRDYLNGQSYFDKIENKQSILNSLLSGNNHSVLEQYLADHDIDRYDKQQCMNRLVNSRAIEYYLTIPYDDFDKKADLIETLFKPRGELGGQSYFDRIENQQPEKHAILSNNAVLEQYLANERISLQNKQLCLNKLAGNDGEEGAIEYYLTAPYNYFDKKVDLIETLFKPRDYLNGQSYFDKIENKQSVARGILSDHNFRRFLERYLTDNNIEPQNRQQCLNGLSRYPETANWLAQVNQNRSSGLIKILFEPQDELNGQSYFDRIENKQLIRNSFLAVEDQPLLERYLADDQIGANDKLQCLNGLNSYPETQDLLRRVPLEQELAVIQTLFEPQNDDLNNQLPLDQYLNDINIPVKNKARTLNSIFTIIERMNEEDAVRINMLNGLKNTLTRQSFVTNFEQGTIQMQRLAIGNAGNEEQAENVALPENVENEEHLQDRKTTFLHIMMDPRYDPEYDENLNITTSDINREEVIQKIGRICPELLLDAKDQLGNTILNQTILLPYPSTVWGEQPEQQVRGNANQENNGNQQNHINQENHEENEKMDKYQ